MKQGHFWIFAEESNGESFPITKGYFAPDDWDLDLCLPSLNNWVYRIQFWECEFDEYGFCIYCRQKEKEQ